MIEDAAYPARQSLLSNSLYARDEQSYGRGWKEKVSSVSQGRCGQNVPGKKIATIRLWVITQITTALTIKVKLCLGNFLSGGFVVFDCKLGYNSLLVADIIILY